MSISEQVSSETIVKASNPNVPPGTTATSRRVWLSPFAARGVEGSETDPSSTVGGKVKLRLSTVKDPLEFTCWMILRRFGVEVITALCGLSRFLYFPERPRVMVTFRCAPTIFLGGSFWLWERRRLEVVKLLDEGSEKVNWGSRCERERPSRIGEDWAIWMSSKKE